MPVYDFRCTSCETAFEAHAEPGGIAACPQCATAGSVQRVWSVPKVAKAQFVLGAAAKRREAERRAQREGRQGGRS